MAAPGFTLASATFRIVLGYTVLGTNVLLFAYTQVEGHEPQLRAYDLVPGEDALETANTLACEAETYFHEVLKLKAEPAEGLSFEDFVEHLERRIKNALH